jgi:hypothetical protein
MKIITLVVLSFIFSCQLLALSFGEKALDLHKGRLFIAGSLGFNYEFVGMQIPKHNFSLNSSVGAGYFIRDRIAVGASLPAKLLFYPANAGQVGLSLFGTYFFSVNKLITPYAGLDITPAYSIGELAFKLGMGINAGILLALNENIALDFGIAPEFYFPLSSRQHWKFEVPAGFVGLRAFL